MGEEGVDSCVVGVGKFGMERLERIGQFEHQK